MQFSNAVGMQQTFRVGVTCDSHNTLQIHSKGVVEPPKKLKARKATDPPPLYNNLNDELVKEPAERNQTTVM